MKEIGLKLEGVQMGRGQRQQTRLGIICSTVSCYVGNKKREGRSIFKPRTPGSQFFV